MLSLIVQAPRSPSKRVNITRSPFRIGNDAGAHLALNNEGILPCHLEIRANREGQAQVIPHGVVLLNGNPIDKPKAIHGGDRLSIASVNLVFQSSAEESAPEAPSQENVTSPVPSVTTQTPPVAQSKPNRPTTPTRPKGPSAATLRYLTLQKLLHKELLEKLDLKKLDMRQSSDEEMRLQCQRTLENIVKELDPNQFSSISIPRLIVDVIDQALGLGPLEDLLKDEDITEIMVNNFDKIYVEKKGKLTLSESQFLDNPQVIEVIRRIIAPIGRRIDETNPMVDARLQDGSRVNAIIPPLAISGPCITIRKFASDPFHVSDLIGFGSLTSQMSDFLQVCVEKRPS
jgi:pilus assembly protein CpaF